MKKFWILLLTILMFCLPVYAEEQENHTVRGQVTWNDNEDTDGLRPYSVTITLKDGDEYVDDTKAGVVNEWNYAFRELPAPQNEYNVSMEAVDGYEITSSKVDSNKKRTEIYDFMAVHTRTSITIENKIVWDDDRNRDGIRPDSVKLTLLADGEEKETIKVTGPKWKFTFSDLEKYNDSKEVEYTVTAEDVEGYSCSVDGISVSYYHDLETTSYEGSVVFDDGNDQDGLRPEEITVTLMDGDRKIDTTKALKSFEYAYSFDEIPKNRDGKEIAYSVKLPTLNGYNVVNGTYTHAVNTTNISGKVLWHDSQDEHQGIEINLFDNGNFSKSVTASADTNWSYTFDHLPANRNGRAITYTIDISDIEGYQNEIDGYDVIIKEIEMPTEEDIRAVQVQTTQNPTSTPQPPVSSTEDPYSFPAFPIILTIVIVGCVIYLLYKHFSSGLSVGKTPIDIVKGLPSDFKGDVNEVKEKAKKIIEKIPIKKKEDNDETDEETNEETNENNDENS